VNAQFPQLLQGTVNVGIVFDMDADGIGAGVSKCFDMPFGVLNHQVYIDGQPGNTPYCFDDERTHGDIWHKLTVHHIYVNPIDATLFSGLDLFS
jgi:hypothetical protein